MLDNVFREKTVLITGHTGFKGSWLSIWLRQLGARIIGYALAPLTDRDNFVVTGLEDKIIHIAGDIRDYPTLKHVFEEYQPVFVFHLAAQPIVRASYLEPKETYDINIGGTVNVLECCRLTDSVKVIVNVTSDKCYENREWIWGYRENDPMGGYDPYSSSKGCSELVSKAYLKSFFNPDDFEAHGKCLSTARAGNVIGGGDWQRYRLIPDCIRALEIGSPVEVRNPMAIRPWQHVLETLNGYLCLAEAMHKAPKTHWGAWNFGPNHDSIITVGSVVEEVIEQWGSGDWVSLCDAKYPYEAELLNLDISKAKSYLNWCPVWNVKTAIEKTVAWYRGYQENDPYGICVNQIQAFLSAAKG